MSKFARDFEDFYPKTADSTNISGHVTGRKVRNRQCSCGCYGCYGSRPPRGGWPGQKAEGLKVGRVACAKTSAPNGPKNANSSAWRDSCCVDG
jgi:hypothetical protein